MIKAIALLLLMQAFPPSRSSYVAPGGSGPTQVFTDSFPYTSGHLENVSGGNWCTSNTSAMSVTSSHTVASTQSTLLSLYSWCGAGTFNANQYASVTLVSLGGDDIGVSLRSSHSGGNTLYGAVCGGGTGGCVIIKLVAGSQTNLTAFGAAVNPGDVIRLEVSGTSSAVLTLKKNGTVYQTFTDSTSPILSGVPGLAGFGSSQNSTISNVTGGNL